MKKIFYIIVIICLNFGIFSVVKADENTKTIIGSNANLNFNIQKIIGNKDSIELPTFFGGSQNKIKGYFWITNIGPVKMDDVKIICTTSTNCSLNGKGVNSTIGEVSFNKGFYNPGGKIFSGKITTNIGDFSLENIKIDNSFGLKKNIFEANNKAKIELDTNFGTKTINLKLNGLKRYLGKGNIIENVDLSKSGKHKIEIEVDGNKKIFDITVTAGKVDKIYIEKNSSDLAGNSGKKIIFKPKDKYGNPVTTGKIGIKIKSTASSNQSNLVVREESNIVISKPSGIINKNNISEINILPNGEASIDILSSVPDNLGKIKLTYLGYNGIDFLTKLTESEKNIDFQIPFEIKIENEEIYPDKNNSTKITITKKHNNIKNIKLIADYSTINSSSKFDLINIIENGTYNYKKSIANKKSTWGIVNFDLNNKTSATKEIITKLNTNNNKENEINTEINFFVQYTTNINGQDKITTIEIENQKITNKISKNIVTAVNLSEISSEKHKTKLKNTIRKNVSYLKRNITNFDNKNYIIKEKQDIELDEKIDKQSYISLGGDIIIKNNIIHNGDSPKAFIAMELNGVGGNIKIAENVTNLEGVVLVADKITNYNDTEKNKQLYIFGSVYSDNNCMEIDNIDCLPNLRNSYTGTTENMAKGSIASKYKHTPVILQYNPKLSKNPPIGLAEIIQ